MALEARVLKFVPISSFVQASFWNKLAELKINVDKLDENHREIYGFFSNVPITWTTHILEVDSTSFNSAFNSQNNNIPFHGKIFNKNTIEQFKDCDKTQLINKEGREFWEDIKTGKMLETPSKLNFFFILSFSDLKKYQFYYWFAFPVPYNLHVSVDTISPVSDNFSEAQIKALGKDYLNLDPHQKAYFLIHNNKIATIQAEIANINSNNFQEYSFAFSDFITEGKTPKSQLKNYIIFILHHCPFLAGKTISFLSLYLNRKLSLAESLIYKLTLPENPSVDDLVYGGGDNVWAGWEKNEKNKFGPRVANMKTTMDPQVLFEESVDLNLKLMKWRLLPEIDLNKIKSVKCLLLGAGTLGCSVARNLLGWGVRNVTFVDNSTVSYSNPVRQFLFNYEDAISNKPKAQAAADNLRKIFPSINAQAHQFTIPMPGHNIGESTLETTRKSVEDLKILIQQHDVIFLLTDSRESRWLPTLLGVFYNKIVINVALGFDTYLIMRYGRKDGQDDNLDGESRRIPGTQLGCYFCNDVTAPGNSLKDRTLDQQCTVTRPGVSSVAGALAVELTVSVLQHEDGVDAPAFYKVGNHDDEGEMGILGIIPHSIRGFLSSFMHVLPATPKYKQCIACSDIILGEFKTKQFDFLLEAFNSSSYLENLTGLSDLFTESNYADVLEISDNEWED